MREIRLYGSEGGEAKAFPTPYHPYESIGNNGTKDYD
jgi:hypothetical protein